MYIFVRFIAISVSVLISMYVYVYWVDFNIYVFNIDDSDGDEWNDAEERAVEARDMNFFWHQFFLSHKKCFLYHYDYHYIFYSFIRSISIRRMTVWLYEWMNGWINE